MGPGSGRKGALVSQQGHSPLDSGRVTWVTLAERDRKGELSHSSCVSLPFRFGGLCGPVVLTWNQRKPLEGNGVTKRTWQEAVC